MPALRRCSASMNADDGWPPPARRDRRDHRPDLGAVEPVEAHLLDRVAALEAQHELAAGLAPGQVVGAVRGDDHEVRPRLLGDAVDEVGAGRVDPVEVLDDEHGRAAGDGGGDEVEHRGRRGRRRPAPGSTSAATASSGRPIEPGWAMTPTVVTRRGQRLDQLAHEARLADARPRRTRARRRAGRRSSPRRRRRCRRGGRTDGPGPTITGLIPTRPLSTALDARGARRRSTRSGRRGRSVGSRPRAGREPGGRPVRRHAGRDRWGRAPPGEVGGGRAGGWRRRRGTRRGAGGEAAETSPGGGAGERGDARCGAARRRGAGRSAG